jgi:serine/threonine-protein kinase
VAGIVHRDLKPANIILERGGRVVILDFGIARWVTSQEHADGDVREMQGTPSYMAPEQFSGGDIDFRTDIYALGVVSFELFTGHKPFSGDIASLAHKHVHELPPDPQDLRPDLPPRMAAVILGCLEKSPEDRFAAVEEIIPLIS